MSEQFMTRNLDTFLIEKTHDGCSVVFVTSDGTKETYRKFFFNVSKETLINGINQFKMGALSSMAFNFLDEEDRNLVVYGPRTEWDTKEHNMSIDEYDMKFSKTADALSRIKKALDNTESSIPDHYSSLWGERKSGSYWQFDLQRKNVEDWNWDLAQENEDGSLIYQTSVPGRTFVQNIMYLSDFGVPPSKSNIFDIEVVDGTHGPELIAKGHSNGISTNIATLILGNYGDHGEVVFTIYPGNPTPKHGCETVEELKTALINGTLSPDTAVKLDC